MGPRGPKVTLSWLLGTGAPASVLRRSLPGVEGDGGILRVCSAHMQTALNARTVLCSSMPWNVRVV